jgi:Lysozyme like domain
MAGKSSVTVPALGALAAGSIFTYAGITGKSVIKAIVAIIQGKSPKTVAAGNTIQGNTTSATNSAAASSVGGIDADALPSAGTYSNAQLQQLWVQAGGSQATAAVAACIAEHESSGNPGSTSSNPDGGTNVGLWQLDTRGVGSGYSEIELSNAMNNARITVLATKNGVDWSDWSTAPDCGV